ncbi:MAG: YfhO family protein [Anaerolineales bacterium]
MNNFDPLVPERYQRWMDRLNSEDPSETILDMMNVNQIIRTSTGAWQVDIRTLPNGSKLRIVGCQEIFKLPSGVLEVVMNEPEKHYQDIAIISKEDLECSSGSTGTVEISSAQNGYLKANISVEKAAYLFWAESWYPGWLVRIDGGKTSNSLRANYMFQAAAVTPGNHQVEFIYRPASFMWGGAATIFSLLFGGLLFVITKKKN